MPIKIADRFVGPLESTFVVAEIGVNHDGSARRAMELVELAAACGADAVKLQLFHADTLMHGSSSFAQYQAATVDDASPAAMLRRFELSPDEVARVVVAIRHKGMVPIATPFSPQDVTTIEQLGLPALKVASPDLVNTVLLRRAMRAGVPLLLSTGASTPDEIAAASHGMDIAGHPFALLHCVSSYPTPAVDANLCWINELKNHAEVVGYSDHCTEVSSGGFSVMAGACIVEKHLTYDRDAKGPDHAASADPREFELYVKQIRLAEKLRGVPGRRVLDCEQDVRRVSRQSLVAIRPMIDGDVIRESDLAAQRPGTGIPAGQVDLIVGKRVRGPIASGTLLYWTMIRDAA